MRSSRFRVLSCLLLTSVLLTGCETQRFANLYVDNSSKNELTVEIDGRSATIRAKDNERYKLSVGNHKITVKSNGRVIFSENKEFQAADNDWKQRNYVLDPTGRTRYAVYRLTYVRPEDARKGKKGKSVKLRTLPRAHWVSIPQNAQIFSSNYFAYSSKDVDEVNRLFVQRCR